MSRSDLKYRVVTGILMVTAAATGAWMNGVQARRTTFAELQVQQQSHVAEERRAAYKAFLRGADATKLAAEAAVNAAARKDPPAEVAEMRALRDVVERQSDLLRAAVVDVELFGSHAAAEEARGFLSIVERFADQQLGVQISMTSW